MPKKRIRPRKGFGGNSLISGWGANYAASLRKSEYGFSWKSASNTNKVLFMFLLNKSSWGSNISALAVSRGQAGFFPDFPKLTHLVNPLTGESPRYFEEIAVSASTAALADGLSTAASFLPEEKIREMISYYAGAKCYVVEHGRARRIATTG